MPTIDAGQTGPLRSARGGGEGTDDAWNDIAAKTAVKVAHEKVNRLIKQCKQAIDDVRLAIQLSNDRIQDRSTEENSLKKVS